MVLLTGERSLEIKKRLARKIIVEGKIIDWSSLSGAVPLWNLTKLQDIYEDLIVINDNGWDALLMNFSDFLSEQSKTVLMFPADGFIVSFDFEGLYQSKNELKTRPIVEVSVPDLKKTKETPGWLTPEDIYFFDEDFSWILFLCHEKFQVLCGRRDFIGKFKDFWTDYENFIDEKWLELFGK